MNYKTLLLIFLVTSCTTFEFPEDKKEVFFDKTFSNTGFTIVYNDDLKSEKIISHALDNRSLTIFQKNLKKGTFVKITNLKNNKSIIAEVSKNAKYPIFYNSVITKRISDVIDLDLIEPYIKIKEINKNSTFVASKAKTFDEEKNVADKAPVEGIVIKSISSSDDTNKKISKKSPFLYIINLGEFYYLDSANSLKTRIKSELGIKKVKVSKLSKTKFRVFLGPYKNLESLKEAYISINKLNFENVEIIKL